MLEAQDQPGIEELMTMPPPQPNVELEMQKAELQHKIQMDYAEQERKRLETKFKGVLAIAQAEAQEKGTQMAAYQQILTILEAEEQRVMTQQQQPTGGESGTNQAGRSGLEE